jgi:hypothetical protein
VGAVTHPGHVEAFQENRDQPYGTEHERAQEPSADPPMQSQEAGRPTLSEASGQGADTLSAAQRRTRQRRSKSAVSSEGRKGGVLVLVHHAAVNRHIGGEDGDELALERRGSTVANSRGWGRMEMVPLRRRSTGKSRSH